MAQKLSKKTRDELASLINSLQVSKMLEKEARAESDWQGVEIWTRSEARTTVELFETFGISLPNLESAQERVRLYREAQMREHVEDMRKRGYSEGVIRIVEAAYERQK